MNLGRAIRDEMSKIAKKEARREVLQLRRVMSRQRAAIAQLRREIDGLKQISRSLKREKASPKPVTATNIRFSARGLKAVRARLGLSAAHIGLLIGCSGQSVYNYEMGKSAPSEAVKRALAGVRKLGKREAAKLVALKTK